MANTRISQIPLLTDAISDDDLLLCDHLGGTATVSMKSIAEYYKIYLINNPVTPPVTPPTNTVMVSTLAGSTNGSAGFADGVGSAANFRFPRDVAVDSSGNVYVADAGNHRIRKITPSGVVSTFAGTGIAGSADGQGALATFNEPVSVAFDSSGNLYVADAQNHRIRKITPAAVVSTLAGSTNGFADGTGNSAKFGTNMSVAVDSSGNVYVADCDNRRIRKITPAGVVTTLAGNGTSGSADGQGVSATFNKLNGINIDIDNYIYVTDSYAHKIRKITSSGVVSTFAGTGIAGSTDGDINIATFNNIIDIVIDPNKNIYVSDGYKIRKITSSGIVSTLAGSTVGLTDGTGDVAKFSSPSGIDLDSNGNLYVAESNNHKIRKITQ